MKVKIKVDCPGSEDGCKILYFKAGKEYDITDKLSKSLIKKGLAIDSNSEVKEIKEIKEIVIPKKETIEEEIKEKEVKKEPKKKAYKKKAYKKKTVKKKLKKTIEKIEVKKKSENTGIRTKMFNSYENKAISSSPQNKRKIIKKIKIKKK